MASKIEGYRERGTPYTPSTPKENKLPDIQSSSPVPGPEMSRTIEEHMSDINKGRPGVPDNYSSKKKDK